MFTRARVRALVAERWPVLLGGVAVAGYAILVVGFGLDFRPLHHDEVVTLHVAGQPSARDVLHVAVQDRHGPPLHYLVVHASLDWRHDILGLRLPSALFGILAVGLAYGCGRELMGRAGGATVALVTAITPITIHLAQFARGYTAMIACAYGSLWLMLVLVRTGRALWAVPYAAGGAAARRVPPVRPLRARVGARAACRPGRLRPGDPAARRPRGTRGRRRRPRARRRSPALAPPPLLAAPVQVRGGEGRRGRRPDVAVVLERPRPARDRIVGGGVLDPRRSGRGARHRFACVPRPARGDRGRGVAAPTAPPASGPHRVVGGLRPRAPSVVPPSRLRHRARRVRAGARPPPRPASRRRRRRPGGAPHAHPRVGPQRPLELQRRPARREPRARGGLRPARRAAHDRRRARAARGPAAARRLRRARRARPDAARGLEDGRRRQPLRPDPPARAAGVSAAGLAHRLDQAPARRRSGAHRRRSDDVDLRRRRGAGSTPAGTRLCAGRRRRSSADVSEARLYRFAAHSIRRSGG